MLPRIRRGLKTSRHRIADVSTSSLRRRGSLRRQNCPLDLAKSDAVAVTLAPAAHGERIAVFEERALDAGGKLERFAAVPADFQKTAALMLFRTGDRAAA